MPDGRQDGIVKVTFPALAIILEVAHVEPSRPSVDLCEFSERRPSALSFVDFEPAEAGDGCGGSIGDFGQVGHNGSKMARIHRVSGIRGRCAVERVVPLGSHSCSSGNIDDCLVTRENERV